MFESILCSICQIHHATYHSPQYGFDVCHECLRTTQLGLTELMGRPFIDAMLDLRTHNVIVELGMAHDNNRLHGQFNVEFNTATSVVDRSRLNVSA